MLGKTPSTIIAEYPLKDGVISDLLLAEKMIEYFMELEKDNKPHQLTEFLNLDQKYSLSRPKKESF
jgi:actin-like ATPase involved in cell morphogenesis